jgi:hypothetical protein
LPQACARLRPYLFFEEGQQMKKAKQLTSTVFVLFVLLYLGACSSSVSSVKQLNESNAELLIRDRLKKEPYKIRAENISKLLARTLKDYKSANAGNDQEATVKRLLEKGFVLQAVETVNYPRISGTFSVRFVNMLNRWETRVFQLEMIPNSNLLTGTYTGGAGVYKVTGSVQPDGKVEMRFLDASTFSGYTQSNGVYREVGPAASLDFRDSHNLEGKATGQKVEVRWYTYSWSPDFQKQLLHEGNETYVIGGGLEVGNVSDLRLVLETEATAKFNWKASLNSVGELFFPSGPPSGAGEVAFGKRPDGTWFVDQLQVNR